MLRREITLSLLLVICSLKGELLGWTAFFLGVASTAFGSAYYHLKPDDARLVWDRLPVRVFQLSFAGIFIH